MTTSLYFDKKNVPNQTILSKDLGHSMIFLDSIFQYIQHACNEVHSEWKYYSRKTGWILKIGTLKRNIVFIIPHYNKFTVACTLGERASQEILKSNIDKTIKEKLLHTISYVEGRTLQIEITTHSDCDILQKVIAYKLDIHSRK